MKPLAPVIAAMLAVCPPPPPGASSPAAALAPSPAPPQKRALIVALSKYDRSTGWGPLSSAADLGLIKETLAAHGFTHIAELTDDKATRRGILDAIERELFVPSGAGDVLVFHYSGHGQQITDDADEEVDGYDEALVAYDAPQTPPAGYKGDKHVRDDELALKLDALRRRVGPTGNVVLWLDSCNSGTGARGTARVRGGAPPIGPPRPTRPAAGREDVVDFADGVRAGDGAAPAEPGLAPYVVFSAAPHDRLAYEIDLPGGGAAGSLSYALSRVLKDATAGTTYRSVFEAVKGEMVSVPNRPQRAGDLDSLLFSGRAVTQAPFREVLSVAPGGGAVTIKGGTLTGLLNDSRVEVHGQDARTADAATLIAAGRVTSAGQDKSQVTLDAPADAQRLARGRAFVTRYALGPLRIRVQLQGLDPALRQEIERLAGDVKAVQLVATEPDVEVRAVAVTATEPAGIVVAVTSTGVRLLAPAAGAAVAADVVNRLQDYARNQYMRQMALSDPRLQAHLELVPVKVSACADPDRPSLRTCRVEELPAGANRTPAGDLQMPVGSFFRLRTRVSGGKAFVAVLDLMPDGTIGVMWPREGDEDRVTPDVPHDLDLLYGTRPPLGPDTFLMVATETFVDFWPAKTTPQLRAARAIPRGALGDFAAIFDDDKLARGGDPMADAQSPAATDRVLFEIVPRPPAP